MFVRCYSLTSEDHIRAYSDCSVCDDWHLFSNFKRWMETKDWTGKDLDKDILVPKNKIYMPDRCIFIPHSLNSMLTDTRSARGQYPIGVSYHRRTKKYQAQCMVDGKKIYIGYFQSPDKAYKAYREFKSEVVIKASQQYPEIREELLIHAKMILSGEMYD